MADAPWTVDWADAPDMIAALADGLDARVPVVAIAGAVGSGKSTLARVVAGLLAGVVLATDRYLPDYEGLPMAERDLPERSHLGELAAHTRSLAAGEAVDVPIWSFFTHRREGSELIGPAEGVVVEGIHALHKRVNHLAGLRVLIEADAATRWDRLVARELSGERGWSIEHMRAHFETVAEPTWQERAAGYRAVADLIVRNG